MEKLMGIDSDYWSTFLGKDEGEDLYRDSRWVVKSIRMKLIVVAPCDNGLSLTTVLTI